MGASSSASSSSRALDVDDDVDGVITVHARAANGEDNDGDEARRAKTSEDERRRASVQPYFATERGRAAAERARLDALEEEASANDGTDIERESASSVYAAWVLDRARAFKDAQASAKVTAARANASARELTARLSWMTSTNAEIDDLACASEDAACAVLDLCASLDALDDVFARASELDVVDET